MVTIYEMNCWKEGYLLQLKEGSEVVESMAEAPKFDLNIHLLLASLAEYYVADSTIVSPFTVENVKKASAIPLATYFTDVYLPTLDCEVAYALKTSFGAIRRDSDPKWTIGYDSLSDQRYHNNKKWVTDSRISRLLSGGLRDGKCDFFFRASAEKDLLIKIADTWKHSSLHRHFLLGAAIATAHWVDAPYSDLLLKNT
jgi:hypothetical protein